MFRDARIGMRGSDIQIALISSRSNGVKCGMGASWVGILTSWNSDLIEWCTRFGLEIAIEWSLLAGTLTDLEL
jgi:hypothetical protein